VTESEREFVVDYLQKTRDRVVEFAASLTPEQRDSRPAGDGWSAASLIEHIVIVERMVDAIVTRMIAEGVPDESRRGKGAHKDAIILERVAGRVGRAEAPESAHPSGQFGDFESLLREFETTRACTLEIARTVQKDLRVCFATHPFLKDLDGYQWLLIAAAHSERHVRQAEETL